MNLTRTERNGEVRTITPDDYARIGEKPNPVMWQDQELKRDYSVVVWRLVVVIGCVLFWVAVWRMVR